MNFEKIKTLFPVFRKAKSKKQGTTRAKKAVLNGVKKIKRH